MERHNITDDNCVQLDNIGKAGKQIMPSISDEVWDLHG